jgi:hypothetical protein
MTRPPKVVVPPSAEAVDALFGAMRQTGGPVTAAQLAKLTVKPFKLSEKLVLPLLEERAARGELHAFPPATAKGKPRYWDRDESEFARLAIVALLDKKGPQTKAAALKAAKGLSAAVAAGALQSLLDTRRVCEHPPIGKTKTSKLGTKPPAPEPYLKEVSSQLATVVSRLTSMGVRRETLLEAVVAMMAQCGLPLPLSPPPVGNAASNESTTPSIAPLDLILLMTQLEPGAEQGALVSARDLRRVANLDKSRFDRAVLDLARAGRLMLHRHDHASSLSAAERDELVTDGTGTYFVGMAIRRNVC